jgi:hypothetical protein
MGCASPVHQAVTRLDGVGNLFVEHFFDLADFALNLAVEVFRLAFRFKVRIVSELAYFFFRITLDLMDFAFEFIFVT